MVNEKRLDLIDRNAFIKRFDGYGWGDECDGETVLEYLADAPTVDAVEVVRCKDFRAWDRGRISCEGLARCNSGEGGIRYRSGNDYCSKGVKVSDG